MFEAKQKVEVWRCNAGLVFKSGELTVHGWKKIFIPAINALFHYLDRALISMISDHLFIQEDYSGDLTVI